MRYSLLILLSIFLLNCKQEKPEEHTAQSIIDKSIVVSGGEFIDSSLIAFDFRDKHYSAFRQNGTYHFERKFRDSSLKYFDTITQITDILNNKGFMRLVNDFPMNEPDSMVVKYSASVNSVHYFSVLPYGLNDEAVNKKRLEDTSIKGENYYTIQVTFDQNGGGEDFEDVFVYWVNKTTEKVDYLAYSYNEDDGKGIRFREAYNERYVKGIRFVDYNNYKPEDASVSLTVLPQLFESANLKLLSKIELENVRVSLN
ncbi:DUF6503 family protein [Psychroserpens sp. SPM9]|uniref:DUF6503 family protein n=1 Tax=Psychroserpens sp. SPM9 TaxID=2975598 RepID=UPI0021A62320|nr:DUF6503 family protein [Psychroserpens sp. SPM9]MDG5491740.1 deoxyribose-phosphate aldolase [Psychroserpens sp. SPM9]